MLLGADAMSEALSAGEDDAPTSPDLDRPNFIVGIGASAGGLEALEAFFEQVPLDSGMAFVVVQHLSPDFKSLMDEILSRRTKLPVHLVEDGVKVERDRIYLIPAKKEMTFVDGKRSQSGEGVRTHPVSRNQEIRGLFFDYRRLKRIVYHLFVELYSEI